MDIIYQINEDAASFYRWYLTDTEKGKEAREYLESRGLPPAVNEHFQIGCAPGYGTTLYRHLKKRGYEDEDLLESGLFTKKDGKIRDLFYSRLMFPIRESLGLCIGFSGRLYSGKGPKYLNTPETRLFEKKENLFGFNAAKTTESRYFILVEGQMDVIAMHAAGFTNTVASLGTSLTSEQCRLMKRHRDGVVVMYDWDEAGRKASLRSCRILKEAGLSVVVVPKGDSEAKDPDELLKAEGVSGIRKVIAGAVSRHGFVTGTLIENYRNDGDIEKLAEGLEYEFERDAEKMAAFVNQLK